jgi:hypothetical protein
MIGGMELTEVVVNSAAVTTPQRTYADILTCQKSLYKEKEAQVMSKLVGDALARSSQTVNIVDRSAEENIGRHLLQSFDEESEDEGAVLQQQHQQQVPVIQHVQKGGGKEKKTWGPVMATRMSSRIQRDGKSAIEKAQELKKAKNLDAPKGKKILGIANSFAVLSNEVLLGKAQNAGINLGNDSDVIDMHISALKNVEIDRLEKFHDNNPDMFLPSDISQTVEELVNSSNVANYGLHGQCDDTHTSVDDSNLEPWVEVSYSKSCRRKIKFKNGSSSNLES